MKQDEKFVITINRELGSGGRSIGEKLAKRLCVPFYDKALIQQLKEKYGFAAPQYISGKTAMPDFLITDDIFQAETEILKGIADDGSCVIAGRSGFHIFRDHPNHLSILIQASMDYRVSRLMKKQSISAEEARKIIDEVDEGRENYVKKYTGSSRYDTRNYQLVINVDGHTEDDIVEMILMYLGTSGNKIVF